MSICGDQQAFDELFSRFSSLPTDPQREQMIMFIKNFAMTGRLQFVIAFGAGSRRVQGR